MSIPVYLTPAQVKAYAPTNELNTSTVWDGFLTTVCETVSRAFDHLTFRAPGAYAVTEDTLRYFDGKQVTATDQLRSLWIDELAALTSLAIAPNGGTTYTPIDAGDFWLWPYNATVLNQPYQRLDLTGDGTVKSWPSRPHSIQITGKFGYSTNVPADVTEALLLYTIRFVRKAQQNYLEVGQLLDTGQVFIGAKTDYDLQALIAVYRRGRLA